MKLLFHVLFSIFLLPLSQDQILSSELYKMSSMFSSVMMRFKLSRPYNTSTIIILYILIFRFLEKTPKNKYYELNGSKDSSNWRTEYQNKIVNETVFVSYDIQSVLILEVNKFVVRNCSIITHIPSVRTLRWFHYYKT